jgi:hypothetical protein
MSPRNTSTGTGLRSRTADKEARCKEGSSQAWKKTAKGSKLKWTWKSERELHERTKRIKEAVQKW